MPGLILSKEKPVKLDLVVRGRQVLSAYHEVNDDFSGEMIGERRLIISNNQEFTDNLITYGFEVEDDVVILLAHTTGDEKYYIEYITHRSCLILRRERPVCPVYVEKVTGSGRYLFYMRSGEMYLFVVDDEYEIYDIERCELVEISFAMSSDEPFI